MHVCVRRDTLPERALDRLVVLWCWTGRTGTAKVLLMVDVGRPYAKLWTWDQYMTHLVPHNLKAYRKLVRTLPIRNRICSCPPPRKDLKTL